MVVRIRLARFGRKGCPKYRIMAADSRAPRDGRHLEVLGSYDPIVDHAGVKQVQLNIERIKYWLVCGAQPSKRVARLLGYAGVLPPPPITVLARKPDPNTSGKYCRPDFGGMSDPLTPNPDPAFVTPPPPSALKVGMQRLELLRERAMAEEDMMVDEEVDEELDEELDEEAEMNTEEGDSDPKQ